MVAKSISSKEANTGPGRHDPEIQTSKTGTDHLGLTAHRGRTGDRSEWGKQRGI